VPPSARWQAGWSGISRISLSPSPMIERNNLADPTSPCQDGPGTPAISRGTGGEAGAAGAGVELGYTALRMSTGLARTARQAGGNVAARPTRSSTASAATRLGASVG